MSGSRTVIVRRRESCWEMIKSYPSDLFLGLWAEIVSLDYEQAGKRLSFPLAAILNGIYVCIRLTNIHQSQLSQSVLLNNDIGGGGLNTSISFMDFLEYVFILISILNTLYLFTRTRTYQLLEMDINEPISSNNARIVDFEISIPPRNIYEHMKRLLKENIFGLIKSSSIDNDIGTRKIWVINPWDLTRFNLDIFCLFSPVQTFAIHYMKEGTIVFTIGICALFAFQLRYISGIFLDLLRDKRIIDSQVMNEYNIKFVNPRIFAPVRSIGIGTEATIDDGFYPLSMTPKLFSDSFFTPNGTPTSISTRSQSQSSTPYVKNRPKSLASTVIEKEQRRTLSLSSSMSSPSYSNSESVSATASLGRRHRRTKDHL